ncbi:hypothetical protein GCM10022393_35440 [Aquimarina addita]|uniref:NfeD integral membrane domain-containing protein n=1 Tax=Aquimarina addita TaxID=870485 RepID=A0ABP6UTC1_9FLAO
MNSLRTKRVASVLLMGIGTILLIIEMISLSKNYYLQSLGIVCLMIGLYLINASITSKSDQNIVATNENFDKEEKEEELL